MPIPRRLLRLISPRAERANRRDAWRGNPRRPYPDVYRAKTRTTDRQRPRRRRALTSSCARAGRWRRAKHRYSPFFRSAIGRLVAAASPTSHKGSHGRLVIIGGDRGTAGAIRMAGEAALRAGAGLVRVLTREENIAGIVTARPELMVHELNGDSLAESLGGRMSWRMVPVLGKANGVKRRCGR